MRAYGSAYKIGKIKNFPTTVFDEDDLATSSKGSLLMHTGQEAVWV
jgi:hypothetical protein